MYMSVHIKTLNMHNIHFYDIMFQSLVVLHKYSLRKNKKNG